MEKIRAWITKAWHSLRQRPSLGIGVVAFIALVISAYLAGYYHYKKPVVKKPAAKKEVKKTTKPSPLTGLEVKPALAERPITGVVIENHPDARPQSGLGEAGVVYEALAEGGITRFLAFFEETRPAQLGPVRSLRTYFVDWALEFDAAVAHVGGNYDALQLVGPLGMKDMNEFAWGNYFYRATDRYAPHNAYTTSDNLDELQKRAAYFGPPKNFKPSPRKKDSPEATPSHPNITVDYSYSSYLVEYKYDAKTNSYARYLAGEPHIDRNTGKTIMVKNIVVQYMPTSYGTTDIGEQTVIMGTPGSGRAVVFRDGGAVEGTWSKTSHTDRAKLTDNLGQEIKLNAGNTWYCIVPDSRTVSF